MRENEFYDLCDSIESMISDNIRINQEDTYFPRVSEIESLIANKNCTPKDIVPLLIYFANDPYKGEEFKEPEDGNEYRKLVEYAKSLLSKIELEEQ